MMLNDYDAKDVVYQNSHTIIQRYCRQIDGKNIILKTSSSLNFSSAISARLRYEYKILKLLSDKNSRNIIRPVALQEGIADIALLLEDMQGVSLAKTKEKTPLTLEQILSIAVQIVMALQDSHAAHVVHKDINPSNIIYNPLTQQVQLIDFGIAAQISQELQYVDTLHSIEGTLAYISPEQTGKINRLLDYRTDYYSLGVTLYELVSGQLPFPSDDPARLIHAILAKFPTPIQAINPTIPQPVVAIINKLMEKIPEKRYQSASGILHDLHRCLEEIKKPEGIAAFELATHDQSEVLIIPQKLYGREQDVALLRQAYQRVTEGHQELVLLTGASGMGKSAMVHELQQDLLERGGFFLHGKYDQLRRHVPFSALNQAIGTFIRRLLIEDEKTIRHWRQMIQHVMGNIGQILIDIIPSLELLVGKQKPTPELGLQETENRLLTLLQRFMRVIGSKQPMVLFLDDIQWADPGTLRFLTLLCQDHQTPSSLLIIAAYRHHDIAPGHAVFNALQDIKSLTTPITTIHVDALTLKDIDALLHDTMASSAESITSLAEHVLHKTAGNPFFVHTFIKRLWDKQLLFYDATLKQWHWDLQQISQAAVADNVVAMITEGLKKLTLQELELVGFAACLGSHFSLQKLSLICEQPSTVIATMLDAALRSGIILALEGNYRYASDTAMETTYKFIHDRVQQAAYEILTPEKAIQSHYKIGKALLQEQQSNVVGEWIFGVVDHLNRAADLIKANEEILQLVQLNVSAAEESRKAASYTVALEYLERASKNLPKQAWEHHYALTRFIYLSTAANQFMAGDMDSASSILTDILNHSRTPQERAEVQHRRMLVMTALARYPQALQAGKEALQVLGYPLASQSSMLTLGQSLVTLRTTLWRKDVRELVHLPECKDAKMLQTYAVLTDMMLPAYLHNTNFFVELCMRLSYLTIRNGLSQHSSCCFIQYAVVLDRLSDFKYLADFVYVSEQCLLRFPQSVLPGAISFYKAAYAEVYWTSGRDICSKFDKSMLVSVEDGDPLYASWSAVLQLCYFTLISIPSGLNAMIQHTMFVKTRNEAAFALLTAEIQWAKSLSGLTHNPNTFDDDSFDMMAFERAFEKDRMGAAAGWYYSKRCIALWMQREMSQAVQAAVKAEHFQLMELVPENRITTLFMGLAIVADAAARPDRTIAHAKQLKKIMHRLRAVTTVSPRVYAGFHVLLEAELAALRGQKLQAVELYEESIEKINHCGYPPCLAAALECAARFHHDSKHPHIAKSYFVAARNVYLDWGATVKVKSLTEAFPDYLMDYVKKAGLRTTQHTATSKQTATTSQHNDNLALPSVLRSCQALASEISTGKLLSLVVSSLIECAGATRAVLLTLDLKGQLSVAIDSEQSSNDLPHDVFQYVVRTGEDWVLDKSNQHLITTKDIHQKQSILCTPVMLHGTLKGVIYLENKLVPNVFTQEKELSVRLLATQAFISLENARLLSHLEETVSARTLQLQEAHNKLLTLERETTEMQMAGGFAHEMRNALSIARMPLSALKSTDEGSWQTSNIEAIEELRTSLANITDGAQQEKYMLYLNEIHENQLLAQEMLEQISVGVNRGLLITKEILHYAEVGQIISGDDSVVASQLLEKLLSDLSETLTKRSIETKMLIPSSLVLPMKEDHAYAILRNLLANAADALTKQPVERRQIVVQSDVSYQGMVLTVRDTGTGMSLQTQNKIFQPFFSTKGVDGTGLGLGLSRRLARIYHGDLKFISQEGVGTTFTLSLPTPLGSKPESKDERTQQDQDGDKKS